MKEIKRIVEDLEQVFAKEQYPQDFLNVWDQMECLASHTGRETFLVQRKSDGQTAVATCYDQAIFSIRPGELLLDEFDHPGLPRCYEKYQNENMVCIVREYIEGEPLNRYAREHSMSQSEIVKKCIELCDILEILHSHVPPVIHRDIKPENIIVRPEGSLALIDFDIARFVRDGEFKDTIYFGTKGYAPPEQYGFGQTDNRSDIYAFGILLRYLVTGSERENQNIMIDESLKEIIDRCTAFSPEQRFGDISEVRQALRAVGTPATARIRPGKIVASAVALLLALCAGFLAGRYTDWFKPAETYAFQEPLIERAARLWIGKEDGALTNEDLEKVTRIYIYGTQAFSEMEPFYQCSIDQSTEGPIRTLDDLKLFPNLEEVHIVHQGYVDTAGVAGLARLQTLELKHMRLSGSAAIADAPGLRHAILFCTGLNDVTALENCPWLETLDIGLNDISSLAQVGHHPNVKSLGLMWLEMDDVNEIAQYLPKVEAVTLQHGSIGDLSGLKALEHLEVVYALDTQAEVLTALFEGTDVQIRVTEN